MKRICSIIIFCCLCVMTVMAQRADYSKMSSMVRRVTMEYKDTRRLALSRGLRTPSICAFVRINQDAEQVLRDNHCLKLAQFGNIYIANIPLSRLASLSMNKNVARIEAGERCTALMDTTHIVNHLDPVYEGYGLPQAYTGKGVIMGVQDIGFDLTHPNFYDVKMENYRIKRFWDQLSPDSIYSDLYVGADYTTQDEILTYAHSRDGLTQGHGTHTLGIAAGSGFDTPFRGVAFESDICLVSNAVEADIEYIDSVDYYKFTSATDALGFKYILDYAEREGKPCVVSYSEGSHQDFYGDDQLYYEVLDSLSGPGRIIVASAGNEGHFNTYFHKSANEESQGTFLNRYDKTFYFRVVADGPIDLRFVSFRSNTRTDTLVVSSQRILEAPDSLLRDTVDILNQKHYFAFGAYPFCYDDSRMVYEVAIKTTERFGYAGYFLSAEIVGEGVEADFYAASGSIQGKPSYNPDLTEGDASHCIYSPGSAPSVICAGASAYRTGVNNYKGDHIVSSWGQNGEVARYSSIGPTVDGRIKPDVLANGTNVISSYSSFYREEHPTEDGMDIAYSTYGDRSYPWRSDLGTSMSTPIVSGIIALWLEACPNLTPDDIKDVFAKTCIHHDPSLEYPNNSYGWGEIDAHRGLLYLLGLDGIEEITREQPQRVHIAMKSQRIEFTFVEPLLEPVAVSVFTTAGTKVMQLSLPQGSTQSTADISSLPTGVYALQLHSRQPGITGSVLIRK
ncbi:MAG: S8 family serine peptidase [Prevotella sp.]|nr:S8 family serine peptidase [Prevotella sp.]